MEVSCRTRQIGIPIVIALLALALAFSPWISRSRVYRPTTRGTQPEPVTVRVVEPEQKTSPEAEITATEEVGPVEARVTGERVVGPEPGPVRQTRDVSREEIQKERENIIVRAGRAVGRTVTRATQAVVNYFTGDTEERRPTRTTRRAPRGIRR